MPKALVIVNQRSRDFLLPSLKDVLGEHEFVVVVEPEAAKKNLDQEEFAAIIIASREFGAYMPMEPFVDAMPKSQCDKTLFLSFDEKEVERYRHKVRGVFLKGKEEMLLKEAFDELMS